MRRAMICVSFMLAVLQLWPVVFGRGEDSGGAAAAARAIPAAVAHPAPLSTDAAKALASKPKLVARQSMPTCYQTYERKFGQCGGGDSACQLKVGDDWDVCEATGLWPA